MDDPTIPNKRGHLSRRLFLAASAVTAASTRPLSAAGVPLPSDPPSPTEDISCGLTPDEKPAVAAPPVARDKAGVQADPYLTPAKEFRDVSRGKPIPHTLSDEQKQAAGLTRETWQLEITSDPDAPAKLGRPMSKADGTAFTFDALLKLGEQQSVRFPKLMTCLNLGCPLGMGIWEGVPLRDVIWLTEPRENLRRVFYYGFHNNDPTQMFRSSLPIGRILEDPFDLPPVILCYKLNGEWLDAKRGGPVRIVVPEAYGFKSVKWLSHVVLTNLAHANDTYAEQNNDIDSPMKTFAATLNVPAAVAAGEPIVIDGYAQSGISRLLKVQVSVVLKSDEVVSGDPYFTKAAWVDAELIPHPSHWGAIEAGQIPSSTQGFDARGEPQMWPMRLAKVHWQASLPGLPAGEYSVRCRTIDEKGMAQPMPRPFRKSGHAALETVTLSVTASQPNS